MSNIISIDEMKKIFQEETSKEDLKKFCESQYKLLKQYSDEINFLKQKNLQLENLITTKYENNLISSLDNEEIICIQQIDRLEKISTNRELTLEEVKKLDLLVKNLKLIRDETTIVVNNKNIENQKEADLVAIIRAEQSKDNS